MDPMDSVDGRSVPADAAVKGRAPLVYACAGCSSAGQVAYQLALELDRRGHAEMSCLAGVAAQKKPFLAKMEDRVVWIIDGCPIECAQGVLDRVGRPAMVHVRLHEFGIKKHCLPEGGVELDTLVDQVLAWIEAQTDSAVPPSPADVLPTRHDHPTRISTL